MRVLSARLGMSPGHILYYFGSKDRLLLETLQWSEDDLMRRELAKVARARSNIAKVRKIVEGYTPRSSRDPRWLLWAYTYAQPPRDQGGLAAVQESLPAPGTTRCGRSWPTASKPATSGRWSPSGRRCGRVR